MGRKCNVKGCPSASNRSKDEGVTFHKIPPHMDVRPKWLSLCRIPEDKKNIKILYVCSRHFLRADFCNFKGKKYMLKHGVLPSVFPWDKSKLEAIKAVVKNEKVVKKDKTEAKEKPSTSIRPEQDILQDNRMEEDNSDINQENDMGEDKMMDESMTGISRPEKQLPSSIPATLNFAINSYVEALDFNNEWCLAKIMETDEEEKEVLIHFIDIPSKHDEWISMNSSRLRPAQNVDLNHSANPVVSLESDIDQTSIVNTIPIEASISTEAESSVLPTSSVISTIENVSILPSAPIASATVSTVSPTVSTVSPTVSTVSPTVTTVSPTVSTVSPTTSTVASETNVKKEVEVETYVVGERCLAAWSDCRKFPATVSKVLENDTYEVIFDDGFPKVLKAHRMAKALGRHLQSSPLFEPIRTTKQDRRTKKRKLNVATLFKKRRRIAKSEDKQKRSSAASLPLSEEAQEVLIDYPMRELTAEEIENWKPSWYKGKPVGIESTLKTQDGLKTSYIVPDPRLPEGWNKHILKKKGFPGKWDTVIVSPEDKKFRSKTEIAKYLEEHPIEGVNQNLFDFSLVLRRKRKDPHLSAPVRVRVKVKPAPKSPEKDPKEPIPVPVLKEPEPEPTEEPVKEESNANCLKILFEDSAYKCPIEGCGKNFRRENLAQMHVKHYHPEYTKFLDSTPNVADLAYARTVGENLDRSPGPQKPPLKPAVKIPTPRSSKQLSFGIEEIPEVKPKLSPISKTKDQEIIKLLNTRPHSHSEPDSPLKHGYESPTVPHFEPKLRDLLMKSEPIPNKDEFDFKPLMRSKPGIKTLLPVHRPPPESTFVEQSEENYRPPVKRKSIYPDSLEIVKGIDQTTDLNSFPSTLPITASSPTVSITSPSLSLQPKISSQAVSSPVAPSILTPPIQPPTPSNDIIIEGGEVIKIVRMRQEEIINCTCGLVEEDGLMIQCELCLCWQHAYCNNIERESQVPEKYVCYICQNPLRERLSRKYYHDQDWLTKGVLPVGSYHTKDEEALQRRFEKLKKCHDLSGALLELGQYQNSLKIKMKIAETKNHPKHYLWSKPWPKANLPEKFKSEMLDIKPKIENDDPDFLKSDFDEEKDAQNENSMLMMILKAGKNVMPKIDLNTLMDNTPIIPQPEAVTDPADCRLNLLEHLVHQCSQVEERLDDFEKQIELLEEGMNIEEDPNCPKTRNTMQLLMRDLETLKEFSQSSGI
ncbi:PHD finger protein 20 isoform X2 [Diabrotica virgifera virgifera]|uniref:PHD finger protein 20-like n=1 Tax=Diabrotica virgifera virgifera TaxID=50390 RepID=A0ABM5JKG8_DIAVI|nr:PHD finger protein 20 isoform X2 [Diabrotica virgifera virgifera]